LLTGKYSAEHKFEKGDVRAKWQELYFKQLLEIVQKIKYILEKKQRSTAQACIQFVLRQPVVSTVITGIKTAEQAFENFNAASVENITLNEIEKIFQPS